jgi:hypothetical protein
MLSIITTFTMAVTNLPEAWLHSLPIRLLSSVASTLEKQTHEETAQLLHLANAKNTLSGVKHLITLFIQDVGHEI